MYKIIGSDQKEYGPMDAAVLRRWYGEGRVNGQTLVQKEGEAADWKLLATFPELVVLAPPPVMGAQSLANDSISTIIPYKNPPALIAYYLGIFSFIPFIGLFIGAAALVLGIMGLKRAKEHAEARGRVHAWIGIVAGGFFALLYLVLAILIIVAIARGA